MSAGLFRPWAPHAVDRVPGGGRLAIRVAARLERPGCQSSLWLSPNGMVAGEADAERDHCAAEPTPNGGSLHRLTGVAGDHGFVLGMGGGVLRDHGLERCLSETHGWDLPCHLYSRTMRTPSPS